MLFNSLEYILIFLPIVVIIYYYLNSLKLFAVSQIWLVCSSLFFYAKWNVSLLPLLLFSIVSNYGLGHLLISERTKSHRKLILVAGISFNVVLLGYFKYTDFLIDTLNTWFGTNLSFLNIVLPLAISFFTFQQIAFLVDSYRGEIKEASFINYILFIAFFPQLIAGPIVHHKEMMPQFARLRNKVINYKNIALGLFIFSIGLFKKVILADRLAVWATTGFDQLDSLSFIEGWIVSYSYTFQLYFDFSGYMDMAMGAALLFNIKLPLNFNSPYKATNIQECWSRWHMTLGNFLYRYIYMPLNKFLNRKIFTPLGLKQYVQTRTSIALILLFLISGIWHGAGWTFVAWGLMHGVAQVIHRWWEKKGYRMNKILAWFITFNFINASLIFFRANSFEDVGKVLKGMLGMNGMILPPYTLPFIPDSLRAFITFAPLPLSQGSKALLFIIVSLIICLCFKNSVQLLDKFKPKWYFILFTIVLFIISILYIKNEAVFLYFNF